MLKQILRETREIGKRFRVFRRLTGKTLGEFSREVGYPREYISLVEKGMIQPYLSFIHYFCHRYRVNFEWLARGKGEIFQGKRDKREGMWDRKKKPGKVKSNRRTKNE